MRRADDVRPVALPLQRADPLATAAARAAAPRAVRSPSSSGVGVMPSVSVSAFGRPSRIVFPSWSICSSDVAERDLPADHRHRLRAERREHLRHRDALHVASRDAAQALVQIVLRRHLGAREVERLRPRDRRARPPSRARARGPPTRSAGRAGRPIRPSARAALTPRTRRSITEICSSPGPYTLPGRQIVQLPANCVTSRSASRFER